MHKFYVLSTGRAGSTFLAKTLERYVPQSMNLHQRSNSRLINICSNIDLALKTNLSSLFESFDSPNSSVDPQQSVFIYNSLADHKQENAKVIVLVRDPRSFVTSMMNWKNRRLQSRVSHHIIPFWAPVPMFHGVNWFKYLTMSKLQHFAWTWKFKNELFLSLRERGYDVLLVKMEDAVSNPQLVSEIMNFIGLDGSKFEGLDGVKNASRKDFFPEWKNWDNDAKAQFVGHCGKLMNQLGYATDIDG